MINTDTWEQRKLGEVFQEYSEKNHPELPALTIIQGGGTVLREESERKLQYDKSSLAGYKMVREDDFIVHLRSFEGGLEKSNHNGLISPAYHTFHGDEVDSRFYYPYFRSYEFIKHKLVPHVYGIRDGRSIDIDSMKTIEIPWTSYEEQKKIGDYIESLDTLITLHQRKLFLNFAKRNDWEQRKLVDVVDVRSGRDYKHLEEGDIPVYGTGGYMLSVNEALSDDEDAIGIGRKGTIDNPYILRAPFWTVDTLFYAVPRDKYDLNFVFDIFQNVNWKAKDESTGVPSLSKATINAVETLMPEYAEQKKIGEYFSYLDNFITLHQRKCDETKKLKKFMLQKMFPKKDAKKPEIRFAGFTDDWEQRKFGSLLKEIREKTKIENEDTLLSCAIDGMYLNSELFSHFRGSSNIGYLKVKKNDLILSAQNLHLGNCNVNLRFEHGIISPAYKVYELVTCDPFFIQAWVKQDSTKDFFLNASTEGASVCRKNIVWDELYKQTLPIPKLKEQEQIGQYFNELDNLITLHQRKCDELKEFKKYMLQNMFPQKG